MTKRNSSGLRNAGTIATVAALTLGMAGPGVMTATADENTANGNNGSSETQTAKDTEYTTTVRERPSPSKRTPTAITRRPSPPSKASSRTRWSCPAQTNPRTL